MIKRDCSFADFIEISRDLGFQKLYFADALGRLNNYLDVFGVGLYLQLRTDGSLYVGETIDMRRRQERHKELGVRLQALAVMPFRGMTEQQRLDQETRLIHHIRDRGFRLANKQKLKGDC